MEITREVLVERLDGLRKGREQIQHELLATTGAIQDCEHWLSVLEQNPVDESEVPHGTDQ